MNFKFARRGNTETERSGGLAGTVCSDLLNLVVELTSNIECEHHRSAIFSAKLRAILIIERVGTSEAYVKPGVVRRT